MTVRDLDGRVLEVTDLKAAIDQADEMRTYNSDNPSVTQFAKRQQLYWQHMYEQLIALSDNGKKRRSTRR